MKARGPYSIQVALPTRGEASMELFTACLESRDGCALCEVSIERISQAVITEVALHMEVCDLSQGVHSSVRSACAKDSGLLSGCRLYSLLYGFLYRQNPSWR